MQKAGRKRPVMDENGRELSKKIIKKLPKTELSPKVEKVLDDIATGKEKLVRYDNFDEYIKHVKQVLEE
ncbi:hypothetical protein [Candidatus Nitrosotalea okcheonensis]|uniref:Uncharacterized protein n=1 Tax=Candidatus Nitrosotalea okcheonensis TaxID=1903276 RepID=A0A2H1FHI8_9ARCH|nr:hypothetical protein [Candidatus Nitrosotalea okcheonensis]MDE2591201.1 hypothetical protein [Patescibacteria group bacterium]SMH72223.1 protein of unknown function [Candidatus Nitrosotalea okcheonensis]